jgi:hypothetical protein
MPQLALVKRTLYAWLAALCCIAMTAHADFKGDYTDGVRAAGDKNWALVETKMRAALDNAAPQAKVRLYGMRFEAYVPHHYLALAASARGNCAAALAALNNPAHIAALAAAKEAAALAPAEQQIRARCQAQAPSVPASLPAPPSVPAPPRVTAPPSVPTTQASAPPQATAIPAARPAIAMSAPATLPAEDSRRARAAVQGVKRDLGLLRGSFAKPEIAALANAKRAELEALEAQAALLTQQIERAISTVDAAALARSVQATRVAASSVQALKSSALSALAASTPVARQPAPPELAALAALYFSGNFTDAAKASVEALNGKAQAHALLLRAAARYSLYVALGETKPEQLEAVKQDLRRAKRSDPGVRANAKYFSPRLLELRL